MIKRRFISIALAILFVFAITTSNSTILHASATNQELNPRVYNWIFNNSEVSATYFLCGDTVVEECVFVENCETVATIRREAQPNGVLRVYHNGVHEYDINADYLAFLAMVQNGIELIDTQAVSYTGTTREIYQVCGSTLYHELVSTTAETISTTESGIVGLGSMGIAQFLMASFEWLAPYAGIIATAVTIYDIINSTPCEYIDITEYKYFVHDYSTNQSKNCFHTYLVFYNITSSGTRQVVDARWECSEVIL